MAISINKLFHLRHGALDLLVIEQASQRGDSENPEDKKSHATCDDKMTDTD
jgi:hypothetical protein